MDGDSDARRVGGGAGGGGWQVLSVPEDWARRVAARVENVRRAEVDYPENSMVIAECHSELAQALEEPEAGYGWRVELPVWLDQVFIDAAAYHRRRMTDEMRRQLSAAYLRAERPAFRPTHEVED